MSGRDIIAAAWRASTKTTNSKHRVGCVAADSSSRIILQTANTEYEHAEAVLITMLTAPQEVHFVGITCWPCIRCARLLATLKNLRIVFYSAVNDMHAQEIKHLEKQGIQCLLVKTNDHMNHHIRPR